MYKKIFFASTVFFLTLTFLYAQTERILEADGSAEKEQSYSETVKQESAPQTQAITGTAAEKGTETAENSAETELLESVKPENTQSAASGSASEKSVKLSGTEEAPLLHGRDTQFTIVEIRYVISGLTKKNTPFKSSSHRKK